MNTLDLIDAHAHLALPEQPDIENQAEDLITQMDITSVDAAVILAMATEKGNLKLTERYNDFIADTAKKFSDRFIGFGSVHPGDGKKALEELDRFCDLGLKGLKVHPILQNFHCDSKEMDSVARKCEDLDIPVLIHSYFPYDVQENEGLHKLVGAHENTKFILAHVGGLAFLDCYAYVEARNAGKDHVYFDVSSVIMMFRNSPYTEQLRWLIEKMGADRVVFGSNYPKYQLLDALEALDEMGLSFEDSQQILARTMAELLKL